MRSVVVATSVFALLAVDFIHPLTASAAGATAGAYAAIVEPVAMGPSATWNLAAPRAAASATAITFQTTGADGLVYDAVIPGQTRIDNGTGQSLIVELRADRGRGVLERGSDTFTVSATVDADPVRARGSYTGSMTVVVAYQ